MKKGSLIVIDIRTSQKAHQAHRNITKFFVVPRPFVIMRSIYIQVRGFDQGRSIPYSRQSTSASTVVSSHFGTLSCQFHKRVKVDML